jgi:hypothetical protein
MAGAFLTDNYIDSAVPTSAFALTPTLPLSGLQDPQPRVRARFTSGQGAVLFDLGQARALDCVAVLSTTATAAATIRVRLATADTTGAAGDAWDSGTLPAATDDASNGQVILVRAAGAATGRYLLVELLDATLSFLDVGRVAAGSLWRLARGYEPGAEEGRLILDTRARNALTGAEFISPAILNPRSARFTLPAVTRAEALAQHRAMIDRLGAAGDGLWIPDLDDSQAELNRRALWGSLAVPGGNAALTQTLFARFARSFTLVERV